jgi:hypothetical protein
VSAPVRGDALLDALRGAACLLVAEAAAVGAPAVGDALLAHPRVEKRVTVPHSGWGLADLVGPSR